MGTTYSKLKQDNYDWNRNSLEIDGFYVSTGLEHTVEKLETITPRRKLRSVQSKDICRVKHSASFDENIELNCNDLETDGGSCVQTHQQLNNRRPLSKISRKKSTFTARGNTKIKKEDDNKFDQNTSIESVKKEVEEKINKAVWEKESGNLGSGTNQSSLESNCGTDEVDNETCASNFQEEICTGIPQKYESHSGEEIHENTVQGSETVTCDGDDRLTNDRPTIEHNDRQNLHEEKHEIDNESSNVHQNVTGEATTYPNHEELKNEWLRFNSYKAYPNDNNKPYTIRLAQGGFFYTGTEDEVMCYVCSGKKADWGADDDPFQIHVKLNPQCQFLKNNSAVNVPMQSSQDIESRIAQAFRHVQSPADDTDRLENNNMSTNDSSAISTALSKTDTEAEKSTPSSKNLIMSSESRNNAYNNNENNDDFNGTNNVGISGANFMDDRKDNTGLLTSSITCTETEISADITQDRGLMVKQNSNQDNGSSRRPQSPKFQQYSLLSARLATFSTGLTLPISAEHLADAGLFHTGYGDCTRCFMCGIGLRHWSSTDDPWVEHARYSINCIFVLEQKGQQFVDLVKQALDYRQQIDNNVSSNAMLIPTENIRPAQDSLLDTLIHQTAAQSILEMGYDSKMVRSAIREILQTQGRDAVTSGNLMEKVFEIEAKMDKNEAVNKVVPSTTESDKNEAGTSLQLSEKKQRIKLHSENELLKQQSICTNCRKQEVSIVYLPCGHLITCDTCAPKIKHCQMINCGKYIMGTVRTYRS